MFEAIPLSTEVVPSVENNMDVTLSGAHDILVAIRAAYFQSVARTKEAAIPPIPIRMFQFPRSDM